MSKGKTVTVVTTGNGIVVIATTILSALRHIGFNESNRNEYHSILREMRINKESRVIINGNSYSIANMKLINIKNMKNE